MEDERWQKQEEVEKRKKKELDLLQQATNPNRSETEVNGNDNLEIQAADVNIDEKESMLKDRKYNDEDNYATLELKPPKNNCDEWDVEKVSGNGCDRI